MSTGCIEVARGAVATGHRLYGGSKGWRLIRRSVGVSLRWLVLAEFAYVFLFPLLFMVSTSVKTLTELNHPSVVWIARHPTLEGYRIAAGAMDYLEGLRISGLTSIGAALGQTFVGAMVAYGFARISFRGREVLFAIVLFTVVVPLPTVIVPQFMLYRKLEWTNSFIPLVFPAFLTYGVRGGILLIVFRQFLRGLPYELEDAAYVDGAGPFRTFWRIMLPLAKPVVLVVLLFSLVWTWNDSFVPWMVIRDDSLMTIPQRLEIFFFLLNPGAGVDKLGDNIFMSATVLTILPPMVLYSFAQRYFTQSVDRTGLVE